jgi:hypothetical protein
MFRTNREIRETENPGEKLTIKENVWKHLAPEVILF